MTTTSSLPEQGDARQLKRRRTALDSDALPDLEARPPIQTSRSETVWMSDGNIILQTGDGTQFRVHKSVLALNSSFFRDMFSLVDGSQANEGDNTERVDGCVVIRMSEDDKKEDLERVLQLVYHSVPCVSFIPEHYMLAKLRHDLLSPKDRMQLLLPLLT